VTWLEDFLTSKWPGSFTALVFTPHDLPHDLSDLEIFWLPWRPGAATVTCVCNGWDLIQLSLTVVCHGTMQVCHSVSQKVVSRCYLQTVRVLHKLIVQFSGPQPLSINTANVISASYLTDGVCT